MIVSPSPFISDFVVSTKSEMKGCQSSNLTKGNGVSLPFSDVFPIKDLEVHVDDIIIKWI